MANRYDFSDERKKMEIPLTKQVESGQIWANRQSGLRICIDSQGNSPEVWNVYTTTLGNRIDTQIKQATLLIDYERVQ